MLKIAAALSDPNRRPRVLRALAGVALLALVSVGVLALAVYRLEVLLGRVGQTAQDAARPIVQDLSRLGGGVQQQVQDVVTAPRPPGTPVGEPLHLQYERMIATSRPDLVKHWREFHTRAPVCREANQAALIAQCNIEDYAAILRFEQTHGPAPSPVRRP